jgi:hypothetical protein
MRSKVPVVSDADHVLATHNSLTVPRYSRVTDVADAIAPASVFPSITASLSASRWFMSQLCYLLTELF